MSYSEIKHEMQLHFLWDGAAYAANFIGHSAHLFFFLFLNFPFLFASNGYNSWGHILAFSGNF